MKLQRWNWKELGLPGPVKVRDANGKRQDLSRIHRIWTRMKTRTGLTGQKGFSRDRRKRYYTHVTMCDEWRYFPNFYRWAMSHGYREDLTIDRIDWRGGYSPDNCRWATYKEQNKNRHLTERFWEAARRNVAIAREAKRRKRLGI